MTPSPSDASLREAKDALRRRMRECLRHLSPLPPELPSFRRLLEDPLFQNAAALVGYIPIQAELPVLPLLAQALRQGKRLLLPRFQGEEYTLALVRNLEEDLRPGKYRIPEPAPSCPEVRELPEPALWLIPGLAFDRRGARLGRGGGFYDRLRARHPGGYPVGLCRQCQLLETEEIPAEPWDRPVRLILTPEQWVIPHAPLHS
ncbi:MAG: 5-formyltetrahydrofolate cyclo-ligase [Oligosphaeraceae bacterium]